MELVIAIVLLIIFMYPLAHIVSMMFFILDKEQLNEYARMHFFPRKRLYYDSKKKLLTSK